MAKRKAKSESEAPTEAADAAPAGETITKTEAVKRALSAGKDQPKDGVQWIKEEFGLDMTTQQFSTNKFQIKNKGGASAKPGRKAAAASAGGHHVGNGRTSNPAELAAAVKALVKVHGAAAVSDMAKVFAD